MKERAGANDPTELRRLERNLNDRIADLEQERRRYEDTSTGYKKSVAQSANKIVIELLRGDTARTVAATIASGTMGSAYVGAFKSIIDGAAQMANKAQVPFETAMAEASARARHASVNTVGKSDEGSTGEYLNAARSLGLNLASPGGVSGSVDIGKAASLIRQAEADGKPKTARSLEAKLLSLKPGETVEQYLMRKGAVPSDADVQSYVTQLLSIEGGGRGGDMAGQIGALKEVLVGLGEDPDAADLALRTIASGQTSVSESGPTPESKASAKSGVAELDKTIADFKARLKTVQDRADAADAEPLSGKTAFSGFMRNALTEPLLRAPPVTKRVHTEEGVERIPQREMLEAIKTLDKDQAADMSALIEEAGGDTVKALKLLNEQGLPSRRKKPAPEIKLEPAAEADMPMTPVPEETVTPKGAAMVAAVDSEKPRIRPVKPTVAPAPAPAPVDYRTVDLPKMNADTLLSERKRLADRLMEPATPLDEGKELKAQFELLDKEIRDREIDNLMFSNTSPGS
jgi:hypothetical protein